MTQPGSDPNQFFNPASQPGVNQVPIAAPPPVAVAPAQPEKKKFKVNKNVFVFFFFLLFLGGTVYGLDRFTGLFSKASESRCLPLNVKAADLTSSSAEITFQTNEACQVTIAYGTSNQPEALLLEIPETMALLNHRIKLSPLLPSTAYYYQILSEDKPVSEVYSLLTQIEVKTPTLAPIVSLVPTETPAASISASPSISPMPTAPVYTLTDFQEKFGSSEKEFDLDGNGVVNLQDWFVYQKL